MGKAAVTYDYIVERADHFGQVQTILDRNGAMGYRLAQPLIKVGTKSYQIIMERETVIDNLSWGKRGSV